MPQRQSGMSILFLNCLNLMAGIWVVLWRSIAMCRCRPCKQKWLKSRQSPWEWERIEGRNLKPFGTLTGFPLVFHLQICLTFLVLTVWLKLELSPTLNEEEHNCDSWQLLFGESTLVCPTLGWCVVKAGSSFWLEWPPHPQISNLCFQEKARGDHRSLVRFWHTVCLFQQ